MREVEKALRLAEAEAHLRSEGFKLREIEDLSKLPDILEAIDKPYVTPVLDPANNVFTQDNCVWLAAKKQGEYAAVCGARRDRLGAEGFGSFLERQLNTHYGQMHGELSFVSELLDKKIGGTVVYLGDLFVSPTFRGNISSLRSAATVLKMLISLKWSPDWTYAFVREKDVTRKAVNIYGFTRQYPFAKLFKNPLPPRSNEEVLVLISREELEAELQAYSLE